MDTLTKLQQAWETKHLDHLDQCFKYSLSFFEDSFEYQGVRDDGIVVDGKLYSQSDIIKILAEYYTDDNSNYESEIGDSLYLFFTDLVEDDVDILSEIDEEAAS